MVWSPPEEIVTYFIDNISIFIYTWIPVMKWTKHWKIQMALYSSLGTVQPPSHLVLPLPYYFCTKPNFPFSSGHGIFHKISKDRKSSHQLTIHTQLHKTLRWRHNGGDSVSNHQPRESLLRRLIRRTSKKISKLRVTGLCAGNSPETGEFPAQMASSAENVSIWWRHHDMSLSLLL